MQAPLRGDACTDLLELTRDLERDDGGEQRDAFDERGENQGSGLNAASRFRLTRHAFNRLAANATDTEASADDGETRAETGADEAEPRLLLAASAATWSKEYMVIAISPNR